MIELAQDMLKVLQERVGTTLDTMADLADSVGAPPVASLIHGLRRLTCGDNASVLYTAPEPSPMPELRPTAAPAVVQEESVEPPHPPTTRRRSRDLPPGVRALTVEDAVNGSTYLARIVWCLGVAEREGTGALRPADMARMIMSRSPVSLEPPNVARYIRRSKPTCIVIDRTEGSSSFYRLNEEGRSLFNDRFGTK